jgi:hypothetical protein
MKLKNKIILLVLLLANIICFAQFGPQQIISTNIGGARSVFASDLDGDGDMDILSASRFDDKVSWFKNTDGLGSFGDENIITDNLPFASIVFAIDLDGDGDNDVLSLSPSLNKIVWYENLNGLGNFGDEQIISNTTLGAISVHASDLDDDGDMDVLSASYIDNKIAWYENIDGEGDFGPQQIISTNAMSTRQVYTSDIDGDGDMDVIYVSTGDDKVIWHKNDGFGNFGPQLFVTANANGVVSVFTEDLDGDGDMDVLAAIFAEDEVVWYENTNGQGNFGPQQIISSNVITPRYVFASDIDNDGDIDVLAALQGDNKIIWHENLDGFGSFGLQQIISDETDGAFSVFASDLDNDGDLDVLSASLVDSKIAWYENFTILSVTENRINSITLSPNPTKGLVTITEPTIIIKSIKVYDMLGKQVLTDNNNSHTINLTMLQSGLYLVKVETEQGNIMSKVIKE